MKKITRFLLCTLITVLLLATAASATACHQKEEYPTVSEVTEPQPVGEIIPVVDRQEQLTDAKENNPDTVAWLYMRVLKPLTVCESVERSPSTVWMLESSFPSAAQNSCRTRSIWVAVEARRFGT